MTATKKQSLEERLVELDACPDAVAWAKEFETASQAWQKCENPEWMCWALEATGKGDERLFRKYGCWCVRNTPLPDGRKVWDLLADERSRNAVEVAERFVEGKATDEELSAARSAAWSASAGSAAWSASWSAAGSAAWSASGSASGSAAGSAARSAARAAGSAAWSASWSAAGSASWSAAGSAAWSAAGSAQCKALRKFFGNPFKGE